jgi:hypothetical protein
LLIFFFQDGTGEFLDAWLMLVEKMVNTKNVLESRHTLPTKSTQPGFVPFSPLQYLIKTHKVGYCFKYFTFPKLSKLLAIQETFCTSVFGFAFDRFIRLAQRLL